MERAALSGIGFIVVMVVGVEVLMGFLSGEWAFHRVAMFGLGLCIALVLTAAVVAWSEVKARRDARLRAELTEKFAERIPHTVPAVMNLACELGHADDRTIEGAPVLELHGDGRVTLRAGQATSAWSGTYDLHTVRKVRNHNYNELVGAQLLSETAAVFCSGMERAAEPIFALDVMWLALPEVRDYLRDHVPAGIRNDFTEEWRPRRRPAYLSSGEERRRGRWRHSLVSTYGRIEWDDNDREKVTITALSREAYVPSPERLAETRRHIKDAAEMFWTS